MVLGALGLALATALACGAPQPAAPKPTAVELSPVTGSFPKASGAAAPKACVPRVRGSGGELFALDPSERSKRVQAAMALKYPESARDAQAEEERARAEPAFERKFVFKLLPKRWGGRGPVPWQEVDLPNLQRFIEPSEFYYTEVGTGEFEYPWVAGLVVARQPRDTLEVSFVRSANFSDEPDVIEPLLLDVCASSPSLRSELTLAVRELYALGDEQPNDGTTQDGSCTVTGYHLYEVVWRYLAIDFSVSGLVRHIYVFNPKDEQDSQRRRVSCSEHAAEP